MAVAAPQSGFRTLLRKRNFVLLWMAQLISMTVLNASNYAILVLIEEITGSTTLVGLAIISFSLPAVLFGAPAGVFVDHLNKRRVLWSSNCLRAIATFGFVVSLLLNRHELITIYLLTFLISGIGQFFTPAEGSTIPMLVNEEELLPALSLFNITFMLAQALGFILLAPLVLSFLPAFMLFGVTIGPIVTLYSIMGVLYGVCALLVALIPPGLFAQAHIEDRENLGTRSLSVIGNVWSETKQGWHFIRRNHLLFLAVIQLSFAGVLLLVIGELATPLVTKLFELPPSAMAFIFAPAGIGLVVGSVLMPGITRRLGKTRAIFTGTIIMAVDILFLPFSTIVARFLEPDGWNTNPLLLIFVALVMFTAGFAIDLINVPAQTAVQELTPDWIKGRVLALQLMFYNACSIPVILFIGAIADLFGLAKVIYLISALIAGFGLWGRYYEHKPRYSRKEDEMIEAPGEQREPDKIQL
ncbi:MAG TPA: MFS transporter [Ktedonobacteraceae bacterium]|nr:MFS transporter [Ktedonobacteraceae bacterium]